jgi:ACS family tartrate transporter-like MFS transporter
LEGLPAIILGVIVFFLLVDRPQNATWLREDQRSWLTATLEREALPQLDAPNKNAFSAFRNPKIWLLALVYVGLNTCTYSISLWLPSVIHKISTSGNLAIGFISVIPYLFAAVSMVLVGIHSDRSGERRWHVAICAFTAALAFVAAAYSGSLMLVIIALSVAMAGASSMTGPFWAMPAALLSPVEAAAGIALINSIGNLGGFLGPNLIGFVRNTTGEFKGGFLLVGAAVCLSAVIALFVTAPPQQISQN